MNPASSEQELLENFYRTRDNRWLGELFQRYTLLLLGVCMKYLKNEESARDAVQQVFLKAIPEFGKYRIDYPKSWLYMVAKNHCLMVLRERHGHTPAELTEHIHQADEPFALEEIADREATLQLLESSLTELNREQRTCLTLFYLERKSYQQVSGETGYALQHVKSYIQNGKRNLRLIMERKMKKEK